MTSPDLVVFDLDGTLTRRDTVLPFLAEVAGRARTAGALLRSAPELIRATRDRARRDRAKEALLGATLRGVPATRLAEHGEVYARQIDARQLRPDMVARLRWHQGQGHECVIVSASLAAYVQPLSRRLALGEALATELEVGADGLLTGRLAGANCRAREKLARLEVAFGARPIAWAYGDSVDDELLLARAAHPLLVGRTPVAAAGG